MNTPRVLDAQGRELNIGDEATASWGVRVEVCGVSMYSDADPEGISLLAIDGGYEVRYAALPYGLLTYRCPDLLVQKGPTE